MSFIRYSFQEPAVNEAPQLVIPNNLLSAAPGTFVSFGQYIVDESPATVVCQVDGSWPGHLQLDAVNRRITVASDAYVASPVGLRLRMTDENGAVTSHLLLFSVVKGTNRAPVWATAIPWQSILEGSLAGFNLGSFVTERDGDTLTYSKVGTWPENLNLNPSTGQVLAGIGAPAGAYDVVASVYDGSVSVNSPSIRITINALQTSGEYTATFTNDVDAYKFHEGFGNSTQRNATAQPWYSARARSTGTIITWGGGNHAQDEEVTVREFDPGVIHDRMGGTTSVVGSPYDLVQGSSPARYYLQTDGSRLRFTITAITGPTTSSVGPWTITTDADLTWVKANEATTSIERLYKITSVSGNQMVIRGAVDGTKADTVRPAPVVGSVREVFRGYPISGYDNLLQMVMESDDTLVICDRGVFDLSDPTGNRIGYTHGRYTTTPGDDQYWPEPGPYWLGITENDYFLGTPNSLGTALSVTQSPVSVGRFNQINRYLPDIDKAVIISYADTSLWIIERNDATSRFHVSTKQNKWRLWTQSTNSTAFNIPGTTINITRRVFEQRDLSCAIGQHLYFVAGRGQGNLGPYADGGWDGREWVPYFLKMDIQGISASGTPQLERLADMPAVFYQGKVNSTYGPNPAELTSISTTHTPTGQAINQTFGRAWYVTWAASSPQGGAARNAGQTVFEFTDSAGEKWMGFWNGSESARLYQVNWAGFSQATAPSIGVGVAQPRTAGSRFGALEYDPTTGLICLAYDQLGLYGYDPTDDAQGWFKIADPVASGPGIRGNAGFSALVYSSKTQSMYYRAASPEASAKWTKVDITPKLNSSGGGSSTQIIAQKFLFASDGRPKETTQRMFGPGTAQPRNDFWNNKKSVFYNAPGSMRLVNPAGDRRPAGYFDTEGYPPSTNWVQDNFPQEVWSIDLQHVVNGGLPTYELHCNAYADFPYAPTLKAPHTADESQSGPRRLGAPTVPGGAYDLVLKRWYDFDTDGIGGERRYIGSPGFCGIAHDANGDLWCGPGFSRQGQPAADGMLQAVCTRTTPPLDGDGTVRVMRMRGAHMPAGSAFPTGVCDRTGKRLGNGWYAPPQPRWLPSNGDARYRSSFIYNGGTYSDVNYPNTGSAQSEAAWCGTDPVKNEMIIVVPEGHSGAGSSSLPMFRIHRFPFTPDARGFHPVTRMIVSGTTATKLSELRALLPVESWRTATMGANIRGGWHAQMGRKMYVQFIVSWFIGPGSGTSWTQYDPTKPADYHNSQFDMQAVAQFDLDNYTLDRWLRIPDMVQGLETGYMRGCTFGQDLDPGRGFTAPEQARAMYAVNGRLCFPPPTATVPARTYPDRAEITQTVYSHYKSDPIMITCKPGASSSEDVWERFGTLEQVTELDPWLLQNRYDFTGAYAPFLSPENIKFGTSWGNTAGVPDLNEVWIMTNNSFGSPESPPIIRVRIPA